MKTDDMDFGEPHRQRKKKVARKGRTAAHSAISQVAAAQAKRGATAKPKKKGFGGGAIAKVKAARDAQAQAQAGRTQAQGQPSQRQRTRTKPKTQGYVSRVGEAGRQGNKQATAALEARRMPRSDVKQR